MAFVPRLRNLHLLARTRLSPTPTRSHLRRADAEYITNPYASSLTFAVRQSLKLVKYTAITVASLSTLTFTGWQGAHLYIEHFRHPTPPSLSSRARNLLHGAYIREEIAPDLELAVVYLREALRIALEDQSLDEAGDVVLNLMMRLADDEARAGNLRGSLTEYARCWRLMVRCGDPVSVRRAAEVAKKLGDLYIRLGEYANAEEVLAWGIHAVTNQATLSEASAKTTQPPSHTSDDDLLVTIQISLANLYATQRNFPYALPLYLQSLKSVQERLKTPASSATGVSWKCLQAIIQLHLSEVLYGMRKIDEAMGWAQRALEIAQKGKGDRDCDECAGAVLNNLGMMLELQGHTDQAVLHYEHAVSQALAAGDSLGEMESRENLDRLRHVLEERKRAEAEASSTTINQKVADTIPATRGKPA
ncbi:hypothetical protein BC936DRAFT_137739 [Jimgerdemannia flammicorona]|uniref:MalT-like TPR region domain-containing protein n=1 Tax=Jimgerdemannia flammicorona TaxID=994334 RepID=A0A433DMX7_9FUNG|nr:hypothetical protein BC936DRAFT_137739 [Jimgerdemannia flammicorona]